MLLVIEIIECLTVKYCRYRDKASKYERCVYGNILYCSVNLEKLDLLGTNIKAERKTFVMVVNH